MHNLLFKFLTLIIGISMFTFSLSASPREEHVPGGMVALHFSTMPTIFMDDKPVNVFMMKQEHDWLVLIPISIHTKPGPFTFTSKSDITRTHSFMIQEKDYPKQYIKVKNKEFVIASAKTLKRVKKEAKLKGEKLSLYTFLKVHDLNMLKPLSSKLRGDFGRRRFFNNKPKNPHCGIDLSGKLGTPIRAPLDGKVTILGDLFYNGKMAIIDHGRGLISAYSHLHKVYKKEGAWVKRGEPFAEVGMSGRVTGPHLHYALYLNGVPINPELFLEDATLSNRQVNVKLSQKEQSKLYLLH